MCSPRGLQALRRRLAPRRLRVPGGAVSAALKGELFRHARARRRRKCVPGTLWPDKVGPNDKITTRTRVKKTRQKSNSKLYQSEDHDVTVTNTQHTHKKGLKTEEKNRKTS
jgi:hypothetical protein